MNSNSHCSISFHSPRVSTQTQLETIKIFVNYQDLTTDSFLGYSTSVALYIQENDSYVFNSETERQCKRTRSPVFSKGFSLPYIFETRQSIKFAIQLYRTADHPITLGEAYTTLGQILGSRDQIVALDVTPSGQSGDIIGKLVARIEKTSHTYSLVRMGVHANGLCLGKKSQGKQPISLAFRLVDINTNQIVYESEVSERETPHWRRFEIEFSKLCNSGYYNLIKMQVVNGDSVVGETCFTMNDLLNTKGHDFPTHLSCPHTKNFAGNITIFHVTLIEKPHFLDYVQGGLQLNLLLGIDYSFPKIDITNLQPHSINAYAPNNYQKAIQGIFEVLVNYHRHKKVKMFGFGGTPTSDPQASNQYFPLTDKACTTDLEGMMDVYKRSISSIKPEYKSYLEPLIREAARLAKLSQDTGANEYVVLVILANGMCQDMQEAINTLIQASKLPLSVLVVGMGNGNFSKMELFGEGLTETKRCVEREMSRFVRFGEVENHPEKLARHILGKIPGQVVEYMYEYNNILPVPCSKRKSERDQKIERCIFEFNEYEIGDEQYNEEKDSNILDFSKRQVSISTPFSKTSAEELCSPAKCVEDDEVDDEDQYKKILSFKRNSQCLISFRWTQKEISEPGSTKISTRSVSSGVWIPLKDSYENLK